MPSTEEIAAQGTFALPPRIPKDNFRRIHEVPKGAGYVPHGDRPIDPYESAALQERARADHQAVLSRIHGQVLDRGGECSYNNNVDLFAVVGSERLLIEAKSLNDPRDAVNQMRYGMGQLFDYRVRYKTELGVATPVLAFGQSPDRATTWIGEILNENGVALITQRLEKLWPENQLARELNLFGS